MPLTQAEEDVLRRIARDNTPMRVTNPDTSMVNVDENQGAYLDNLVNRCVTAPRVVDNEINGERDLLFKVHDFLRPGESRLSQFIARTGISPNDIRNLSGSDLKQRVTLAEMNESHSYRPPDVIPSPENLETNANVRVRHDHIVTEHHDPEMFRVRPRSTVALVG